MALLAGKNRIVDTYAVQRTLSSAEQNASPNRHLQLARLSILLLLAVAPIGCDDHDARPARSEFQPEAPPVRAENLRDWPHWRGPLYTGASGETNLPARIAPARNLAWQAELPGAASSTPVVHGDHVFVTAPDRFKNLNLLCLNRHDGQVQWQERIGAGNLRKNANNMATPSPVTDGERVIALFGTSDIAALDFEGHVLWKRRLADDYGKFSIQFLYASGPLLFDDSLFIQVVQNGSSGYSHAQDGISGRESFLLCLDPATGTNRWRHIRESDAVKESQEAYSSPIPLVYGERREIVVYGADCVTGHDVSTGEEVWRITGLNPGNRQDFRVVASPLVAGDLLIVATPQSGPLHALEIDRLEGTVGSEAFKWTWSENTPDCATPLFYQNKLYFVEVGRDQILTCLDPGSGELIGRGSLGTRWDRFRASPTAADGKIYCLGNLGTVVVLNAEKAFEIVHRHKFDHAESGASIAFAHGQIFLRAAEFLYCFASATE